MVTRVELFRGASPRLGRDLFSCSKAEWHFLIELARTFGWTPLGTTYQLPPTSKLESPAIHNYEPGDSLDAKQVGEADAIAWGRALETAQDSAHLQPMLEARSQSTDQPSDVRDELETLIREFTAYAFGGAFKFTYTQEAPNDA